MAKKKPAAKISQKLPPPSVVEINSTDGILDLIINGEECKIDTRSVGLEIDSFLPSESERQLSSAEVNQFFCKIADLMGEKFGGEFSVGAAEKFYEAVSAENSRLKKST